ncbi:MAG: hypothetical protein M1831_001925 [Alyxoria varia]|nr:MAG: hypothetical protein M1831_001925 [Alyxoria varia]
MPRPKHPIREHFTNIDKGDRKNEAIQCNYCGRQQASGNPKRCQKHLDECPQYNAILEVYDENNIPFNAIDAASALLANQGSFNGQGQQGQQDSSYAANLLSNLPSFSGTGTPQRVLDEPNIRQTLRINDQTYYAIERALDQQLDSFNISGAGLNTGSGQALLKQAFYQVYIRWPDVFNDMPEGDKVRALTSMAQICHRKRRNGNPPYASGVDSPVATPVQGRNSNLNATPGSLNSTPQGVSPTTPATAPMQAPSFQPKPFGTVTIIAERNEGSTMGSFVVCRPSDLAHEQSRNKTTEDLSVNDVQFLAFIRLLQTDDDVQFNPTEDKIMFTFTGGRTKSVQNEVVWRVALEEMHRRGMDPLVFSIYKR